MHGLHIRRRHRPVVAGQPRPRSPRVDSESRPREPFGRQRHRDGRRGPLCQPSSGQLLAETGLGRHRLPTVQDGWPSSLLSRSDVASGLETEHASLPTTHVPDSGTTSRRLGVATSNAAPPMPASTSPAGEKACKKDHRRPRPRGAVGASGSSRKKRLRIDSDGRRRVRGDALKNLAGAIRPKIRLQATGTRARQATAPRPDQGTACVAATRRHVCREPARRHSRRDRLWVLAPGWLDRVRRTRVPSLRGGGKSGKQLLSTAEAAARAMTEDEIEEAVLGSRTAIRRYQGGGQEGT